VITLPARQVEILAGTLSSFVWTGMQVIKLFPEVIVVPQS